MTVTTTNKTAAPPPAQSGTAVALRTALDEIGEEFFERRESAEGLVLTALAGGNAYLLGERGIAKSALCRRVASIFDGALFFEKLLNRQLPLEALFGQIDMVRYQKEGVWTHNPKGKMQAAHFVFLDEAGKAGPAVLDPILTIAIDHLFEDADGTMHPTPTVAIYAASNEVLEPELSAVWDRFDYREVMEAIRQPENIIALLNSAAHPREVTNPTRISLDDLLIAKLEVRAVEIPTNILDTVAGLKVTLAADGIVPTDRRWKRCMYFLQASAWLRGRTVVNEDDLQIMQNLLWEDTAQITKVEERVLAIVSEFTKEAMKIQTWVTETVTKVNSLRGKAKTELAKAAIDVEYEVTEQRERLVKLLAQAEAEGRSTTKLKTVGDAIQNLRLKVKVDLLRVPEERAMKILAAEDDD